MLEQTDPSGDDPASTLHEPRLWRDDGWTAEVIKNEDDEGWAVAMSKAGEAEPALVGPWTMGRDKKNPKPLDAPAFHTLVKTASEVLRRHEQQLHAQLHRRVIVEAASGRVTVALDIVPDDDDPSASLTASDDSGATLGRSRVSPRLPIDPFERGGVDRTRLRDAGMSLAAIVQRGRYILKRCAGVISK